MLGRPWAGQTAFVLGGGPSLTAEIIDRVRDKRTIAVNSTALLVPSASFLLFRDWRWFAEHRPLVNSFRGRAITLSKRAKRVDPDLILMEPPIVQDRGDLSTGHHAVDVALALGARRIVLLGFDARNVAGRSHCHADYPAQLNCDVYRDVFLPAWDAYPERARAAGCEVINATPDSAIDVFERAALDESL